MQTKQSVINSNIRATVIAAFGVLSMVLAVSETAQAQANQPTPLVFQAAGPDATSIQGAVDAFRASLGDNNLNNPGPIQKGRREINWDGGNPNLLDTTAPVNPFLVFLNTRGSQFKTPGLGLSQAPPSGGPQGGLAVLFGNPTYGTIFRAFSRSRLFTPVGSNITEASFSIPGTNGNAPATVRGFGAVFTDVDQPDGSGALARRARPQGEHARSSTSARTASFYSAVSFRPRRATETCPSSASSLMTPASRRSGSRPATLPRGRMTIASMTS